MAMSEDDMVKHLSKRQAKTVRALGEIARKLGVDPTLYIAPEPDAAQPEPPKGGVDWWWWFAVIFFASVLVAALCTMAFTATAHGAPAPVYREPPPLDKRIEGGWKMEWAGAAWTCYFSPQGFCGCQRGEEIWHGDWSLDGTTLTIRQTRIDAADVHRAWTDTPGEVKEWTVTLDEGRRPGGASPARSRAEGRSPCVRDLGYLGGRGWHRIW